MIVRKTENGFTLIKQHHHAAVAGVMAAHLKASVLPDANLRPSVLLAATQHDRGWINLDDVPFWNDKDHTPYSFIDLPEAVKTTHYKAGIDEITQMDAYAGLLCSLHFTSFTDLEKTKAGSLFFNHEKLRRKTLKKQLEITTARQEQTLQHHYRVLKFCDSLSIYACINQPGTTKANEHPWFINGIPDSEGLLGADGPKIEARWLNKNEIRVSPAPFVQAFEVTIREKLLLKDKIKADGLANAYRTTDYTEHRILISCQACESLKT